MRRAEKVVACFACNHGFYLHRWRYVINVMIYKKAGCIELDKLRVILFGRHAMHHNVDNNLLHLGQYGRPGGECHDVAFAKILHTHMATFSQTPIVQFESDAALLLSAHEEHPYQPYECGN
jgi:hypothetical protein